MYIGYLMPMSPVLPQRRTCPCAGGQMLSLQGPLSIAALPGHFLPSKGRLFSNHAQRCSYPSNDHQRCPTGDLAPIPRNSCCPSKAECDNTNCSQVFFTHLPKKVSDLWITNPLLLQVRCIVERCSDGSIAPVPQGQCCPSKRACPAQVIKICIKISGILDVQNVQYSISLQAYSLESSYSKGSDCTKVTCYLARWKPLRQIFIWSELPGKVNKSWWIDHQSINISFPGVREVIL